MLIGRIWQEESVEAVGNEAVLAFAIHDGHHLREDVAELMALDEDARLREEDPFTRVWTQIAATRVVGLVSRFQVDLNRPRDKAVYQGPDDAWGLQVWKQPLPEQTISVSLGEYDAFYEGMALLLDAFVGRFGHFAILDMHSYNHRRDGRHAPQAPLETNPSINVGTATMDRPYWATAVDRFIHDLSQFKFPGGPIDVRENVKFGGGYLGRWVHQRYPKTGLCLSIEVKKLFMDEWTGQPDFEAIDAISAALASTLPGLSRELSER